MLASPQHLHGKNHGQIELAAVWTEALSPENVALVSTGMLAWDGLGDGNWDDQDPGTGHSRWVDMLGNPVTWYPFSATRARVREDTVTIGSEQLVHSLVLEDGGGLVLSAGAGLYVEHALEIDDGTLILGSDSTAAQVRISDGLLDTGANKLTVEESIKLGETTSAIDSGNTISAQGADLLAGADLTLNGGTLTVDAADEVIGFGDGTDFNTNAGATAETLGLPWFDDCGTLHLTGSNNGLTTSAFHNAQHGVTAFRVEYDYRFLGSTNTPGDGFAFVIQDAGPAPLGGGGGAVGYDGILNSVAVVFNLYASYTRGVLLGINGVRSGAYQPTGDVDLVSGHVIHTTIDYDGTTLTLHLEDTSTGAVYTTTFDIAIASTIGSDRAYFGFTAATGGANAHMAVSSLKLDAGPTAVAAENVSLTVAADSTVQLNGPSAGTLGDLTLHDGVTLELTGMGDWFRACV